MRTLRIAALLLVAAALGACQSPWYRQQEHGEIVTTHVIIHTEPAGATVYFNGTRQAAAPVDIPVEYHHVEELWVRQNNHGARMREGWSKLVTFVTFPIWGVASFFHYEDQVRRHVYGGNRHTVSASLKGHQEAFEKIELEGEAEVRVDLTLPARKP